MRLFLSTATSFALLTTSVSGVEPTAKGLIAQYNKQDSECRGQPGGSLRSDVGCASREVIYKRLNSIGWCFGNPEEPSYKKVWKSCASSTRADKPVVAKAVDPNDSLSDALQRDFKTKDNGIACVFPGKLHEAYQAFQDPKWMKDIGCLTTKGGLKAVRIDDSYSVAHGEWKVRVFSDDGQSFTIYTHSCELAFNDGTPIRVCY